MATRIRVTRVHNPRHSYRRRSRSIRRNVRRRSYRRRKMSAKQIKYFGTARQRANLRAKNRKRRFSKGHAMREYGTPRLRRRYETTQYAHRLASAERRGRYTKAPGFARRRNLYQVGRGGQKWGGGFWASDSAHPGVQVWHPIRKAVDYKRRRARRAFQDITETGAKAPRPRRMRHTPGSRAAQRRKTAKRRSRRSNPMLIEFGAVNPRGGVRRTYRRRRHNVARRRHRRSVARTYRRRRHNRGRRLYRRRSNPLMRHHRRRHYHRRNAGRHHHRSYRGRRRNPAVFGQSSPKEIGFMIMGGLVGVAAVKYLPTLLPTGITSTMGAGGGFMQVGVTVAGAFVAGWLAGKWDRAFGDAVMFGGLMQAGSQLLSLFLNPNPLALSGLGDIVATRGFVVPQNPVLQPIAAPAPAKGMGAFRGAFGYRR